MSTIHVLGGELAFSHTWACRAEANRPIYSPSKATAGSLGTLLAYHLRTEAARPVQLILRHPRYARNVQSQGLRNNNNNYNDTANGGVTVSLERDGVEHKAPGCGLEWLAPLTDNWQAKPQPSARQLLASSALTAPIKSLLIATKAHHVVPALHMLKHRLNADSTLVFLQNGYGLLDQVNQHVFPNLQQRPSYLTATTTNGVFRKPSRKTVSAVWSAPGQLQFAALPSKACSAQLLSHPASSSSSSSSDFSHQTNPLLDLNDATQPLLDQHLPSHPSTDSLRSTIQALLACHSLQPSWLPFPLLRNKQLQKVVVNVCINTLSALLDVRNGQLLHSVEYRPLVARICQECEAVFRAQGLIQPGVLDHALAATALFDRVIAVTESTADNISSTLADLRNASDQTELDAMCGYISASGRAKGVPTPSIDLLSRLVQMRLDLIHATTKAQAPRGRGKRHGHRHSSGGAHKERD